MEEKNKPSLHSFKENQVLLYGFTGSFIYLIFGLIFFAVAVNLLRYGNFGGSLGVYVSSMFFIMSMTASVLAGYGASRDQDGGNLSKKMKTVSGILAALIVSLFPVIVYAALAFFIHDFMFSSLLSVQLYMTPVPAAILGGLVGYFIQGIHPCFEDKGSIKKYIMIVSALLLLELALFLIIIYGATGMSLVPFDQGRMMKP